MQRVTSRRSGFTLIELLVVIAIIGVLLAMLLPAVQKVREGAVMTQCQNNLHQLGVALHNYHSQNAWFPPARGPYSTNPATDQLIGPGWMVEVLPYLEQKNIYDHYWDYFNTGVADSQIVSFACPMDPRVMAPNPPYWGMTSYVGVTGSDDDWQAQYYGPQTNGIFNLANTNNRGTRITDITDGSDNTLMVGERPPSSDEFWGMWIWTDYDNLLSTRQLYSFYGDCTFPGIFGPGNLDAPCGGDSNHFWSMHLGGANWLFGSGRVTFLSYGAANITIPLATRAGKEIISEDY